MVGEGFLLSCSSVCVCLERVSRKASASYSSFLGVTSSVDSARKREQRYFLWLKWSFFFFLVFYVGSSRTFTAM